MANLGSYELNHIKSTADLGAYKTGHTRKIQVNRHKSKHITSTYTAKQREKINRMTPANIYQYINQHNHREINTKQPKQQKLHQQPTYQTNKHKQYK